MKVFLRRFGPLLFSIIPILTVSCDLGGNSGSETTNGLAGRVRDAEGRPVAGARVRLLDVAYDPGSGSVPAEARTDAQGNYAWADIGAGTYNVEMSDARRGEWALVGKVNVPVTGTAQADGMLRKPGSLEARLADFAELGDTGYAYVPGTGAWVSVGAEAIARGSISLEKVPAGSFDSLVLVLFTGGNRRGLTLAKDLEIASGVAANTAAFATWAHSRTLPVASGALGVQSDVFDFPWLVRLDADTLFAQASPRGDDIRFADTLGRPLPFEIERWDAASRQAEIWVRLDTVRGKTDSQRIRMYWGRRDAKGNLQGTSVFDSASGFATVYHLAETPNAGVGGYRDATPVGNHATASTLQAESRVPGVIGWAKRFSGSSATSGTNSAGDGSMTAAMPKGYADNASFTVSFWMRCRMVPERQGLLDFGTYGLRKDVHFLLRPDTSIQFGAYDENVTGADPAPWQSVFKLPKVTQGWTHFATVYDASKASLEVYVDGSRADSLGVTPLSVDVNGALRIGKPIWSASATLLESPFNGDMDEIRFENRALPPERIRLDYLTQKP